MRILMKALCTAPEASVKTDIILKEDFGNG